MSVYDDLDSITISGLRVRANHGVFDFERENGQDFVIDAVVWLDVASAAGSDDVTDTVHYGELALELENAVKRDPVDLIETLAERLAAVVLQHGMVRATRITVHKPDAPIPLDFADVAVQVTRAQTGGDAR